VLLRHEVQNAAQSVHRFCGAYGFELQVIGKALDDQKVLNVMYGFEQCC